MTWVLINSENMVCDVSETEEGCFETHPDFVWVATSTTDPVKYPVIEPGFTYDPDTKKVSNPTLEWETSPEGQYVRFAMKRKDAYGTIGVQLGMLFDDIKAGNLETGSWISHIEAVKAEIEKVDKPAGTDLIM